MVYYGKFKILGVNLTACDYDSIVKRIIDKSKARKRFIVAPIATHSIILSYLDNSVKEVLKKIDVLLPDSQYHRFALNTLYGVKLKDRVYGPALLVKLLQQAEQEKLIIFLYGNNIDDLGKILKKQFRQLKIKGIDLRNKRVTDQQVKLLNSKLKSLNPDLLLIGLGSPLQQEIAARVTSVNIPILTVGAAFDFISGQKKQAPKWIQDLWLEWLFRLVQEPRRLWKRYLLYGPLFILLVFKQKVGMASLINTLPIRFLGLILLITSLPLFLILFILIKSSSRGPFIFKQKRMGKDKKVFTMYKIRTMVKDAEKLKSRYLKLNEADGPVFKIRDDPRYTKVGKIISHLGLDELPQLINAVKGDMALVGPRPLPVEESLKILQKYQKRFTVLPGITSPWIVQGAHKLTFDQWMKLDLEYIESKSLKKDLRIFLRTIKMILTMLSSKILNKDV